MDGTPDAFEVLIVGAGPAGLAAALSLCENGIKSVVIVDDRKEGEQNGSRGVMVHAGTLEELDTMGCAESLITRAATVHFNTFRTPENVLLRFGLSEILKKYRAPFPFAIAIPQADTEAVLNGKLNSLGIFVTWDSRVVSCKDEDASIRVEFADSAEGQHRPHVRARYVLGADGARSTVRQIVGTPFRDISNHWLFPRADQSEIESWMVADVQFVDDRIPKHAQANDVVNVTGRNGFFTFIPLPAVALEGDKKSVIWRLGCQTNGEEITKGNLQNRLDEAVGMSSSATISNILWSSIFRVRSAVADQFVVKLPGRGTVILLGDAAHVHSPAGGQGMNLGIRDAIELGRTLGDLKRLSAIQSNTRRDHLLEEEALKSWESSRRNRAIQVIRMTKSFNFIMGKPSGPFTRTAWNFMFWILGRIPAVRHGISLRLTASTVALQAAAQEKAHFRADRGQILGHMTGAIISVGFTWIIVRKYMFNK